MRGWLCRYLPFAFLMMPFLACGQDLREPRSNRIYGAVAGMARVLVTADPALHWQVTDEAGMVVRAWAAAEPGGFVNVPTGGWYRLLLRPAAGGEGQAIGGRFAVGIVVVITGQSQAEAMFDGNLPLAGAHPPGPRDPLQPPVTAVLIDCGAPRPYCAGDNTFWQPAPEGLGARLLLVALAQRWRVPIGLVDAAYGGASAAQLADPAQSAGNRLRRLARSAGPNNAAVILGHGTTDTFFAASPDEFDRAMSDIVAALREHAVPGMPLLLSPLPPLRRPAASLTSSSSFVALRDRWLLWLGFHPGEALDDHAQARAETIRAAQRRLISSLGLQNGGSLARVLPGPDGIHWSEQGVREAARVTAAALLQALPAPPPLSR